MSIAELAALTTPFVCVDADPGEKGP